MEVNAGSSLSNEKQTSGHSASANEGNKATEKGIKSCTFVNHAAIAWQENRKKWTGNRSQQSERMQKDQIISWTTTYEDLLSTTQPFSEPIPLPEMVDFLVDIWQDEGLFD